MPSKAKGIEKYTINLMFWLTFSGVCLLMINPVLMPFFPWLASVFCLSLFLNLQIDKVNYYLKYLESNNEEFKKNRVFVKLGFYSFYKLVTLVLQVAALAIFLLSFALLFGAALTYSNIFICVILSCGVLNLFGYINCLDFKGADIKQAVVWFSFAVMAFLIKFMPIVTLLDKVILVIAVAAFLGVIVDSHVGQKNSTFMDVVKLLVILSSIAFFKVLLGFVFPPIAVNLLWLSALICTGLLLKSYVFCKEEMGGGNFDANRSSDKSVDNDDTELSKLAGIFNKLSLVYELFWLLKESFVSFLLNPSLLVFFLIKLLLSICAVENKLNMGGLISKPEKKYKNISQVIPDLLFLLGHDLAIFFKKLDFWHLMLLKFPMSNYLTLLFLVVFVSIAVLSNISKQIAGIIKKLDQEKFKGWFINNDFIKLKIPWFFSMLKNITSCFQTLLPYFGVSNSAIMALFMSCSLTLKIFLAFLCGFSGLFEGYLFLTYVLFPSNSSKNVKSKEDFWPRLSVVVNLIFLIIIYTSLAYFGANVAYLALASFVVSLIDYYLKDKSNDGAKDIAKFLAILMNLASMFFVCKAVVSLYCTAIILDGTIALSSIIGVIVTASLSFYYVKNQLGNMKTQLSKIILTRLSGLLLFSSFLFRVGGTYCAVTLALNNIPFIVYGSFVYYALTAGLTLSFMAQYVVNIVRSYIFNSISIFHVDGVGVKGSHHFNKDNSVTANKVDKPPEGFFAWLFQDLYRREDNASSASR